MRSQGLRPRDVVALCSDDHMDFAMPLFAALYLGAVCSPWDPTSDADGVCHRMNITKPKMVFVSGSAAAVVAKAAKMAEHDVKIIVFGHVPGFLEFERIIAEPGLDDVEKFIFTAIQSSGEIASILFSSGTTGPPKGVALSHRALIMLWSQEEPYGMAGNVCLTFAPTDWITTTDSIIMTLFLKIPRIILPLFGERTACAFIERYKASWLNLSPTIINRLVKSDVTSMYDLSSVSRVTYAGSRLSAASYTALTELMPKVQIRSYYGLTESCCFVAIQSAKSQPGSCGEIAENSQVKVIDPSTGRTLEPGQRGEILLKFAVMMNCYYNDPQATAQAIDEEGWLHSGDLGYYDEGGEIFVIDRMKDVIRIGDDPDISPSEIEGAILSHPGVKEVALVGHPRPQDDESLIAFVVRSEDLSDKRNQDDRQFRIEDNVLKGREVSYEDEHTSLGEFVLRKLESDPDFVGQIDALTGRQYTYKQIRERSVRCALWMRSYGLRPGDVVGIFADNHIDYAMLSYATLYLGGICCSLDIIWTLKESAHRIKVSKPKLLFVDESVLADIVEAAKIADFDVKIIVFGHAPGFVSFESIIAEPGTEEVEKFVLTPINSPEKIAFLLFTSGTTGVAKGVAASHRSATLLMHQSKAIGMDGNICLTFGPIEWINMMESLMMTLLLKIPRFTLPTDFKPEIACAMIEKYKVNWSFVYAPMVHDILKSGAVSKYDLSSLKRIHYTGYLMPQSHQKAFKEHWPNVQITSGYGMTEAVGYIAIQSAESPPGSCGGIAENAEVKVIDPDTGRKLGPNQRGELLLKFACMMNSYYEDPQTTATVLDDEGWLHSGDIGYYDEAGEVFVIDRIKDRMRLADFDVCPSEIENVISTLSGVEEVACVGKPNPDGDEYAMAFVVRTEDSAGKQITEKEIIDLVAATLTPSRHLRSGVRFIDEIPRTRVGKIRRLALRDMARSS